MSLYFEWRKSCGCRGHCDCKKNTPIYKGPQYYFNQTDETSEIEPDTPTNAIELEVTTHLPYERVKLDSMIETFVLIGTDKAFSFIIEYSLLRDTTPLTSESFAMINQMGIPNEEKNIMNTTNISWTDTIPSPGTHTYTIEINNLTLPAQNIASVEIQDRSINAIIFPPSNPQCKSNNKVS